MTEHLPHIDREKNLEKMNTENTGTLFEGVVNHAMEENITKKKNK